MFLSLEAGKGRIKVLAELNSGRSEGSLPRLRTAAFSLCPHILERERKLSVFFFFFLAVVLHSLWDSGSPTRSLALRAWSPNHWMPLNSSLVSSYIKSGQENTTLKIRSQPKNFPKLTFQILSHWGLGHQHTNWQGNRSVHSRSRSPLGLASALQGSPSAPDTRTL